MLGESWLVLVGCFHSIQDGRSAAADWRQRQLGREGGREGRYQHTIISYIVDRSITTITTTSPTINISQYTNTEAGHMT